MIKKDTSVLNFFPKGYKFRMTRGNSKKNIMSCKKDFIVRRMPIAKLIKNELKPPWLEDIDITPMKFRKSDPNFSDFMSMNEKRKATLILEPLPQRCKLAEASMKKLSLKYKLKKIQGSNSEKIY
ncbi:hypothetical protein SteCoe_25220 [Stentor coeruleus]|uniref:Uncharacterized protein n=1 Tax=Stentor coeruleus TaxID=5963 RepID=A0A1R2BFP8_9CILI|nr:hypothetical protein SteCoe_25220 [Stentor coeruleus]